LIWIAAPCLLNPEWGGHYVPRRRSGGLSIFIILRLSVFFEFVYFFIDLKKLEKYSQIRDTQSNKSNNKIHKRAGLRASPLVV